MKGKGNFATQNHNPEMVYGLHDLGITQNFKNFDSIIFVILSALCTQLYV